MASIPFFVSHPNLSKEQPAASKFAPPVLAGIFYLTLTGAMLAHARHLCGGAFTYAVDDAYIHMALAKTLVLRHIYGITPYEATTASSSVLWPWLVAACFAVFGVHDIVPLVLNGIAAVAILFCANKVFMETGGTGATPGARLAGLIALIFATPLATMTMIGMEHLLHALCVLVFVILAIRIANRTLLGAWPAAALALMAMMTTGLRLEGFSAVLAAAILLAVRGRPGLAIGVGLAALLPIVTQGLIATSHHLPFLPCSVLVKACLPFPGFGPELRDIVTHSPALLPLLAALVIQIAILSRRSKLSGDAGLLLLIAAAVLAAHLATMHIYFFYRYQAYAIVLASVANFAGLLTIAPSMSRPSALLPVAAAIALIAVSNPAQSYRDGSLGPVEIYHQQVTNALFLRRYYKAQTVMVNDIGAVCYYGEIRLVDIAGLGSPAIASIMLKHQTRDLLLKYIDAQDPVIIIAYRPWLPTIASNWWLVRRRFAGPNIVCPCEEMDYLGTSKQEALRLRACLSAYFGR